MKRIENWREEENHGYPYNITIISATIDGVDRMVTIFWDRDILIVSAIEPTKSGEGAQTFDLPDTDLVDFLSKNLT